jgi:hypothetical protein
MAALTLDVGYIYNLRAQVQNTADAAALAGATAVKEGQYDAVQTWALDVIALNQESFGFSSLDDQIIQVGRWDKTALTFTAIDPANANSSNAVRVVSVRSEAPLFLAALMDKHSTTIQREAIAMTTPSCNGVWGVNSVKVPGSVTIDSFDSTSGPYDAGSANPNGDVCSNGEITVSGSAFIDGDVLASTITLNGGSLTITGITEDAVDLVEVPVIDFGDVVTDNDNDTIGLTDAGTDPLDNSQVSNPGFYDLVLYNSENLTLAPGTYIFDDIEMHSNSSLTLTGPTTIYLDDDFEMESNAVINTTQNPADLTIIANGDPDGSYIKLSGSADFYGAILAPNSIIKLSGNGDFYGNIIGAAIEFKGSFSFHVDESLELVDVLKGPVVLVR